MAQEYDFILPADQNASVLITLSPPLAISGWTIALSLYYRFSSPQPIVSKYLASGYTNGQSGITLVNGAVGQFAVSFNPQEISGVAQNTNVLGYTTTRTDSGFVTPLNGGYRLLANF